MVIVCIIPVSTADGVLLFISVIPTHEAASKNQSSQKLHHCIVPQYRRAQIYLHYLEINFHHKINETQEQPLTS